MKSPDTDAILDLRQLYYFIALADHGSISSAAGFLGMAQPSLSENVAKLERKLDVKLAIRGARGVDLTEAGNVLVAHSRKLLKMSHDLIEAVQTTGNQVAGQVTVGLPPSIGLILAVPLAETVRTEMPSVRLHVSEGMSRAILERIVNETIHLGCVYDVPDTAVFASHALFTEELFLVTAPDNWPEPIGPDGRAIRPIEIEELQHLPLVMPNSSHGARTVVERFARSKNVELNVVMEIDALPHITELVCRASAYSILSEAAVVKLVEAGKLALVPIAGVKIERTAYLTRKRSRPMSRAALDVQNCLGQIVQEMIDRYKLSARLHGVSDEPGPSAAAEPGQ